MWKTHVKRVGSTDFIDMFCALSGLLLPADLQRRSRLSGLTGDTCSVQLPIKTTAPSRGSHNWGLLLICRLPQDSGVDIRMQILTRV